MAQGREVQPGRPGLPPKPMNMDEAKVCLDANPDLKSKSGPRLEPPDLRLALSLGLTHAKPEPRPGSGPDP